MYARKNYYGAILQGTLSLFGVCKEQLLWSNTAHSNHIILEKNGKKETQRLNYAMNPSYLI